MWILLRSFLCPAVVLIVAFSINSALLACQVPVFRYALERWASDKYQVQFLSQGPLGAEVAEWLKPLEGASTIFAPVEIQKIDLEATPDSELRLIWQKRESQLADDNSVLMIVQYPKRFHSAEPAAIEKLTESSIPRLLDSPARQEIIKRLTAGDSAVWILLKSGEQAKDSEAMNTLKDQLARDAERLELPSAEELEVDDSVLGKAQIPLQIKFSIIELDRQDTAERFLIDCLLSSEPDLKEYSDQPIAFPVFGRGIVLYALVGPGISPEVIGAASKFIVGPCSCQVKEQNPGFDLLLNCDWESLIGNTLISSPVPSSDSAPRLLTIPPGKVKK